jgi:PAS domain S-box-containing protein
MKYQPSLSWPSAIIKGGMHFHLDCDPQNIFFRCVEDCNEAIMITNQQGLLLYVNPAWERIYGYSKEQAVGQTPKLLHSGHQSPEFYRQMWSEVLNPEIGSWKGELINRSKDGKLISVLLTITPFRSPNGDILGHMGIALDLSGKRELEAKIVHQDRLASIGLLASGLAHEIGTPLGVIRGRAEFLSLKATEPSLKKYADVIVSQIDRISKLIRSLLRVSRSFTDVRIAPVQISAVVEEVMALVGQNFREDHVDVQISAPPDLSAMADFERLEQILLNLVMNSVHAIRKSIQQEGRKSGHFLKIQVTHRNNKIALEVIDSGCGISAEHMKKLFKPFFTTKDIGEGTGLGLAIVAQLVKEIEAEISVQSILGQETTFTLLLNPPPSNPQRLG